MTEVTVDLRIGEGLLGGDLKLELHSDPGTPGDATDDCVIEIDAFGVVPAANTWTTVTFLVPSSQTTLPSGWSIDPMGQCTSGDPDVVWNTVLADVDQMRFYYDGGGGFCNSTNWVFGVDNITVTGGGSGIGTNYCTANPNSSGVPAKISAGGTQFVADNNVTLRCADMPANTFSIFIVSDLQATTPIMGSEGILCLGGDIGRYNQPGEILASGPMGEVSLPIDLTQIPRPNSFANTTIGQTWHFSCWFRDVTAMGDQTSNFSDGTSIFFQ